MIGAVSLWNDLHSVLMENHNCAHLTPRLRSIRAVMANTGLGAAGAERATWARMIPAYCITMNRVLLPKRPAPCRANR